MKETVGGSVIATLFVSLGLTSYVMIFRNEITVRYCMKVRYSTQFHVAGRVSPAALLHRVPARAEVSEPGTRES